MHSNVFNYSSCSVHNVSVKQTIMKEIAEQVDNKFSMDAIKGATYTETNMSVSIP